MLFADKLSEIKRTDNNYSITTLRTGDISQCSASGLIINAKPAEMYYSCAEDFGFKLLNIEERRNFIVKEKTNIYEASLFYKNDYDVFFIQFDEFFKINFNGIFSGELKYINELQENYFSMTGKEVIYNPIKNNWDND